MNNFFFAGGEVKLNNYSFKYLIAKYENKPVIDTSVLELGLCFNLVLLVNDFIGA